MPPVVQWSPVATPTSGLAPLPTTPGLRAPQNIPQEDFLVGRLTPTSPTWVGAPARTAIRAGSQQLEGNLRGFGRFSFGAEDEYGQREVTQLDGNPGEKYRRAAVDARSAANASGMLHSRTADMAVGEAWFRLSEQQRAFFNQYGQTVNRALNEAAAAATDVTSNLMTLYGEDARYALENPQDLPAPAAAPGAPAAPGSTPAASAPASGGRTVIDKTRNPMGGPDRPTPPGGPDARPSPVGRMVDGMRVSGVYSSAPNLRTIRARFGPGAEVRRMGDGRYIVLQEVY